MRNIIKEVLKNIVPKKEVLSWEEYETIERTRLSLERLNHINSFGGGK